MFTHFPADHVSLEMTKSQFLCALLLLEFLHLNCQTKTATTEQKKKQNTNANIKEYKQCVNKTHGWLENVTFSNEREDIFDVNILWFECERNVMTGTEHHLIHFEKRINDALNSAAEQCALTASVVAVVGGCFACGLRGEPHVLSNYRINYRDYNDRTSQYYVLFFYRFSYIHCSHLHDGLCLTAFHSCILAFNLWISKSLERVRFGELFFSHFFSLRLSTAILFIFICLRCVASDWYAKHEAFFQFTHNVYSVGRRFFRVFHEACDFGTLCTYNVYCQSVYTFHI